MEILRRDNGIRASAAGRQSFFLWHSDQKLRWHFSGSVKIRKIKPENESPVLTCFAEII
jgi:hypothetical protein